MTACRRCAAPLQSRTGQRGRPRLECDPCRDATREERELRRHRRSCRECGRAITDKRRRAFCSDGCYRAVKSRQAASITKRARHRRAAERYEQYRLGVCQCGRPFERKKGAPHRKRCRKDCGRRSHFMRWRPCPGCGLKIVRQRGLCRLCSRLRSIQLCRCGNTFTPWFSRYRQAEKAPGEDVRALFLPPRRVERVARSRAAHARRLPHSRERRALALSRMRPRHRAQRSGVLLMGVREGGERPGPKSWNHAIR